jgi:hypothetical protein
VDAERGVMVLMTFERAISKQASKWKYLPPTQKCYEDVVSVSGHLKTTG